MEIQIRAFGFLINEEAHAFSHQGDRYTSEQGGKRTGPVKRGYLLMAQSFLTPFAGKNKKSLRSSRFHIHFNLK